jgi:hypothetical protein
MSRDCRTISFIKELNKLKLIIKKSPFYCKRVTRKPSNLLKKSSSYSMRWILNTFFRNLPNKSSKEFRIENQLSLKVDLICMSKSFELVVKFKRKRFFERDPRLKLWRDILKSKDLCPKFRQISLRVSLIIKKRACSNLSSAKFMIIYMNKINSVEKILGWVGVTSVIGKLTKIERVVNRIKVQLGGWLSNKPWVEKNLLLLKIRINK